MAKPGEEIFQGGDIRDAINAHVAWKEWLAAHVRDASSEAPEISVVASHDRCELGRWIRSEGNKSFGHLPEFAELREQHARFHLKASDILREAQNNRKEAAGEMLNGSEFRKASDMVELGLVRLSATSQCF